MSQVRLASVLLQAIGDRGLLFFFCCCYFSSDPLVIPEKDRQKVTLALVRFFQTYVSGSAKKQNPRIVGKMEKSTWTISPPLHSSQPLEEFHQQLLRSSSKFLRLSSKKGFRDTFESPAKTPDRVSYSSSHIRVAMLCYLNEQAFCAHGLSFIYCSNNA